MASQGSTATQQAAQPQQETPEQRKAREVREEEARREHRHQLIGLFMQDYADEEDHTQTVQPGTATYLAGSLVTKGRTMLIGQAVGTGPIVIDRDMAEKSQGQLRALADADATKGLVRVIENVYWAFYYVEQKPVSWKYNPHHDDHVDHWNEFFNANNLGAHNGGSINDLWTYYNSDDDAD